MKEKQIDIAKLIIENMPQDKVLIIRNFDWGFNTCFYRALTFFCWYSLNLIVWYGYKKYTQNVQEKSKKYC